MNKSEGVKYADKPNSFRLVYKNLATDDKNTWGLMMATEFFKELSCYERDKWKVDYSKWWIT